MVSDKMIVLGVETSCDETAAAVVIDGKKVLSSIVSSQDEIHGIYGGVVPELASRKHIEVIVQVVNEALLVAGVTIDQLDGLAVTQGPGLTGSLLVGFSFVKGLSLSHGIPFVAVNHLEGHINSIFLNEKHPDFPFVALLVSGGHTNIYYVDSYFDYELMGRTRDDAVGEAYDKVAKMLGFGYPGGVEIERLANKGDLLPSIIFKRPFLDKNAFDFSFSGIKSAVSRYISQKHKMVYEDCISVAKGFQEAVIDVLSYKIINAAVIKKCKALTVVGGVAANMTLRKRIERDALNKGLVVYFPSINFCGDNGAMIASIGYHYLSIKNKASMRDDVFSKYKPKI